MAHEHRFHNMGTDFACVCGATMADTRTPEEVAQQRHEATEAFKRRYNAAYDAARSPFVRRALANELPAKDLGR